MAVLDKQLAELRRRLNSAGDLSHRAIRPAWSHKLRLDLVGQPERNEANVITALSCDEAFASAIMFDEFRQEIIVTRPLALGHVRQVRTASPGPTVTTSALAEWLQRRDLNVTPMTVSRSVGAVARGHTSIRCGTTGRARMGRRPRVGIGLVISGPRTTSFIRSVGPLADLGRRPIFRPAARSTTCWC